MARTIAIVTSSRADYGHLYWPLRELTARPDLAISLLVTGAHLCREYGYTVDVIEADGFTIAARVECLGETDTEADVARSIGRATLGFTEVFQHDRPDLLLLIADRSEMLGAACAALAMRIPIAHMEGGERSEGAIDHAIRNALTMMSHVHLTTTPAAARRVIAMGEQPWRVHRVGAPSLDHLRRSELPDRTVIEMRIGVDVSKLPLLIAHHPVTLDPDPAAEAQALLTALQTQSRSMIFCIPNADAHNRAIRSAAESFCADRADARLVVNLEPPMYWGLLHHVAAIVGNSSSGIMEAASIPIPAVNVGRRQQGRERPANVIDVPAEPKAIATAIQRATSDEFRQSIRDVKNPYGDGDAARRIATILGELSIDATLLNKTDA